MNILLTAHGSRGDVYPMIALGTHFRKDGHRVTMFTQPNYRSCLEDAGIRGIFSTEDMRAAMTAMGADWRGIRRMMEWSRKSLEEEFSLLEGISDEVDLVVSTNQEFSIASLAERRGIPAFRLSYIPAIPGDHTPPLIPWQNLPVPVNRLIWKGFAAGLDSMSKKTVNRWRMSHGLPEVKSLTPHMTSIFHTLYAFNDVLAPPHPSWNDDVYTYCGYCFEEDEQELPTDLETFLDAGEKPVYIGFGSVTVPDPDGITRMALEAAIKADVRLVIGRGWTGLGSPEVLSERQGWATPDRVFVVGDVCHTRLFPRLAGCCHHGGSGTVHRAARAGIPQFIMPVFVDQHFWGSRIHKMKVGPKPVSPRRISVEYLSDVFKDFRKARCWKDGSDSLAAALGKDGGVAGAYRIIMDRIATMEHGAA